MGFSNIILDSKITTLPFYVTRCATLFVGSIVERETGFDEYQIMQCIDGKGFFQCEGIYYDIEPLDIVIFNPHVPHQYGPHPNSQEPWLLNWICFLSNQALLLETHLTPSGYRVLQSINSTHLVPIFEQAVTTLAQDSTYNQLQGSHILYTLILEITALKWAINPSLTPTHFLNPIIHYMQTHLEEDLSIDFLSGLINVSPSYLCRQFKKFYQTSPIKYFIKLRMFKAQELIRAYPYMAIKDIGIACGYKDPSYFCAEFKRSFRITPTQYKEEFLSKPY
ncbi:MAG: AraC family transcriptional regulator [Niameybacter sp.]